MALDDIGCRPRQFRPGQVDAIRVAQLAVKHATEQNIPPEVLPFKIPAVQKDMGSLNPVEAVDPYGNWPEDPPPLGTQDPVTGLTPGQISDDGRLASSVTIAAAALAQALNVDLGRVAFVQPYPWVDRWVNLHAVCTEQGNMHRDRSPWSGRRLLEVDQDVDGDGDDHHLGGATLLAAD